MPSGGVKVYVGNLPERARPEDIKDCFSKYGSVVNMELKGNYGFIEYEERRICEEAIDSLNGTDFQGSQLCVEFAHGERKGNFKYHNHHHHHHNHHHNNNNSRGGESKSTDTCFKCGLIGHWARECTSSNGREFVSRKPGRYDDRRTSDNHIREPYSTRDNRDKYIRDERYLPPPPLERGGYDRPYDRYGREPPELEYRREYRGTYDRPYERERDRPSYDRTYPDREYERTGRDNYDRNYYATPRDGGYDRDGYDRRPLPPPDTTLYPGRGRPGSSPPPRRGSYDRGMRDPPLSSYRARSPLPTTRYPDPILGPPPLRPSSPRGGLYGRRRSLSPIRSGRASISYSGRRSPSPISRPLPSRRGPSTPTPPRR